MISTTNLRIRLLLKKWLLTTQVKMLHNKLVVSVYVKLNMHALNGGNIKYEDLVRIRRDDVHLNRMLGIEIFVSTFEIRADSFTLPTPTLCDEVPWLPLLY